jgi:hypothetical protein
MTARHYFCANCGTYTHHQRHSNPNEYGYNVGCLEGVKPFALERVPLNDGVNHPADRKAWNLSTGPCLAAVASR